MKSRARRRPAASTSTSPSDAAAGNAGARNRREGSAQSGPFASLAQVAREPLLERIGLGAALVDEFDAIGLEHRHLFDSGKVADVVRRVFAAGEVDKVARAGIDDGVGLAVERKGDKVAGANLDLLLADLRGAVALDDVAPFLLHRVEAQHEGLLAWRHAQQVDMRALQPAGRLRRKNCACEFGLLLRCRESNSACRQFSAAFCGPSG